MIKHVMVLQYSVHCRHSVNTTSVTSKTTPILVVCYDLAQVENDSEIAHKNLCNHVNQTGTFVVLASHFATFLETE